MLLFEAIVDHLRNTFPEARISSIDEYLITQRVKVVIITGCGWPYDEYIRMLMGEFDRSLKIVIYSNNASDRFIDIELADPQSIDILESIINKISKPLPDDKPLNV